jgi:hypothetical protein
VPAGLVLAILLDEAQRHESWDRLQAAAMRLLLGAPSAFQPLLRRVWQILSGKALEDQSFGPSQMTLRVQRELIEGQYLPALTEPGWQGLLRRGQDESQAAQLVAARLRQILDHWQTQGVDLSQQWDVLEPSTASVSPANAASTPTPRPTAAGRPSPPPPNLPPRRALTDEA